MANYRPIGKFPPLTIAVCVAVLLAVIFGGWLLANKQESPALKPTGSSPKESEQHTPSAKDTPDDKSTSSQQAASDQSKDSISYLVITEWGVQAALPAKLAGKVSYKLGTVQADPTGNQIQAAKILVEQTALPGGICAPESDNPDVVNAGMQYIRSESTKPFDSDRYRTVFKKDILKDTTHAYHLNYITPDCAGGGENADILEDLQRKLASLSNISN